MKSILGILCIAVLLLSATACISNGGKPSPSVASSSSSLAPSVTSLVGETTTTTATTTVATKKLTTKAPQALTPSVIVQNVPFIDQTKLYPTGCESVSAVMVLQYWGYPLSVDTFIDAHLPCGELPHKQGGVWVGCDPYKAFPGNPRTTKGYGCFAPVIYTAVQNILGEQHRVTNVTGMSLDSLCSTYIQNGIPVIVWASSGMQKMHTFITWQTPDGKSIEWKSPAHCLVLTGYSNTHYFFNDPQKGSAVAYSRAACEAAFGALGQQAVVIDSAPAVTTTQPSNTSTVTLPPLTTETTVATTTTVVPVETTTTESTTTTASVETTTTTTTAVESTTTTQP